MTKKYTTKLTYANSNKTTLRTSLPATIVKQLQLTDGDTIKWIITEDNKIQLEKLEL